LVDFQLAGEEGLSALHVVEVATGADTDYTSTLLHYTTTPTWSPDGTRIAFISKKVYQRGVAVGRRVEGTVHVIEVHTREIIEIVARGLQFADYVTWSPVSDNLLVLSSELGSSWYDTVITTIQIVDASSGAVSDVTGRAQSVSYPVWSPDGSQYAFLEGSDKLHIASTTGDQIVYTLPRAIIPFVTWSMDGSRILAPSADPGQPSLIVDLADGGKESELPITYDFDTDLAGPPQWSPANPLTASGRPTIGGTALDRTAAH
jgi:Tol biopolymer transport system component